MISPLTGSGGRTNIALRTLVRAMDSQTTAAMIDEVDVGAFDADKTFSPGNAVILSALAMAAFSTKSEQAERMRHQSSVTGFVTLDSEDNARLGIEEPDVGTNLSVVQTADAVIVAVSGASTPWPANYGKDNALELKDWKAALNGFPTQNYAATASVHTGFKAQADAIWDQLFPVLGDAVQDHKAIHFTGHSMGASVALMLADRLQHETGELPQSVLRLGGPDVGWSGQREHLEESGLADRVINVINSGDFVPHGLPGGKTAGHQVFLDGHGVAHIDDSQHRLDRVCTKVWDFATGRGLIPMYRHFPIFYVAGIADPRNVSVLTQLERRIG